MSELTNMLSRLRKMTIEKYEFTEQQNDQFELLASLPLSEMPKQLQDFILEKTQHSISSDKEILAHIATYVKTISSIERVFPRHDRKCTIIKWRRRIGPFCLEETENSMFPSMVFVHGSIQFSADQSYLAFDSHYVADAKLINEQMQENVASMLFDSVEQAYFEILGKQVK